MASIRDELDAAVAAVLDAGRFVGGDVVEHFEREFAEWCGAAGAAGVASGTDALTIALQAVGVEPGDEVITVANTCVPTVAGIERAGAVPVLVDAMPGTMTIDPERVVAAIGPRTRAIVPVHLYGRPAELGALVDVARAHDLRVVEDCAQAHGAVYRGRRVGTFGDAAAYSFYPTKNVGALGDGGAVTSVDRAVVDRAQLFRNYGEERRYTSVLRGTNSRLDTIQAAILSVKLRHVDDWTSRRRSIAARYHDAVEAAGLAAPRGDDNGTHVYHLYVVVPPDRDEFRAALDEAGVETLVHYPKAIHEHPAYGDVARAGSLEVSARLAASVVSLPLYPELTDDEVDAVIEALGSVRTTTVNS